ncbi:exonuclease SbcCD subunit D [Pseudalkalibacillus caeni]|uniref:Nuclease SbcCD subunit D n=1 Tax=Exobacillus caeni TaxID=2574798 RepID=A0A5R9F539_9BACL|nr:exonuclease SbcCD subunit D [Pseudalkalibacillus caeni]TLS36758.1 exonuclease SbcCD subunit D [Pseudalkalibacillus caeni]
MKFFHTADWHLGKLVQGVYMTEDQREILKQFIEAIKEEKPDAVVIAGDLYDRAVPPTEAVNLLDEVLETIVLKLNTPVLAVAGNHDSPGRLNFGSKIMKSNGCHIVGHLSNDFEPIVLHDEHGEVHFHLIPYSDPSMVRHLLQDDEIRSHNDAAEKIIEKIKVKMDPNCRHVFVGHAFVTPNGEEKENTSDSERPLSIGGTEHINAGHFQPFHYTALGHLHQAHYVANENIRYAGSPLKYSISEENHKKGYKIVEIDGTGKVSVEKRLLKATRDMRTIEAKMEDLLKHDKSEDYVFVRLLDETPVLSPMEQIRSVYPNAMHVERKIHIPSVNSEGVNTKERHNMDDLSLFKAFYREVKGSDVSVETEAIFKDVLDEILKDENETKRENRIERTVTV